MDNKNYNDLLDFEEIANSLHDAIFIANGEGTTLFVNEAYTRITGIKPEEIIGKKVQDFEGEYFKNAVTPKVLKYKKPINSIGKSLKTGKEFLVSGIPIFDEKGNIKLVVVNDRELDELNKIQSQLDKTMERLAVAEKDKIKSELEIKHLRKSLVSKKSLIGNSIHAENLKGIIDQIKNTDVNVLITGETGVGKEVVANEIFSTSRRKDKPYIKINCAAIPENLIESELFGHEKGAFTGADKKKIGLLELADGGTVLLDEIGEMPLSLQPKLLRVIQNKEISRVGGTEPIKINIRIISSTNKNLKKLSDQGKFREDLYYRLNVVPIHIEPLRNRIEDLDELAEFFIKRYNKKYNMNKKLNSNSIKLLKEYHWPGNVRELENLLERLVIMTKNEVIRGEDIEKVIAFGNTQKTFKSLDIKEETKKLEIEILKKAKEKYKTTREMAEAIGIDQSNVVRKMKKYNL
jgi:PAS domain S-box-containing protein